MQSPVVSCWAAGVLSCPLSTGPHGAASDTLQPVPSMWTRPWCREFLPRGDGKRQRQRSGAAAGVGEQEELLLVQDPPSGGRFLVDSDLQPTRTSRPEAQSWAPLMGLRLELNSLRYQVWPDYQCSQTHTHLLDSGHNFYSFPSPPPSAPVSRAGEVHGGRVPPVVHILPRGLTGAWSSQRL